MSKNIEKSEFGSFSSLTKRLLSVPKKEIDKRHEEWKRERASKEKKKKQEKERVRSTN